MRHTAVTGLIATLAASAASLLAYPRLPERVPVHWGLDGNPDRYGSRLEAALVGPAVVLALSALLAGLSRVDRAADDDAAGSSARAIVESTALWLVLAVHGFVLAAGLGVLHDVPRALALGLAAFLLAAGNVMGRVRPNRIAGIRTPWTLRSGDVWRRTHRLAGRLMVGAALLLVPAAVALRGPALLGALLALVLGSTVGPAAYSYVLYRRGE